MTDVGNQMLSSDPLTQIKPTRGSRLIVGVVVGLLVVFLVNLFAAKANQREENERRTGARVVRNVKLATQKWVPADDGMTLTVTAVTKADSGTIDLIRSSLASQRAEHLRADYSDLRFGNDDIPGRADLEFGTTEGNLNVRYFDVPGGGKLRWITEDEVMLESLREWGTFVASSRPSWADA